jgi:anti-sigma regulatory factor (Ser/Thr protein kinase)
MLAQARTLDEPRPPAGPMCGPPADAAVRELAFDMRALAALRRFLGVWAADESLDAGASEELVLAVNELASNSIRHGGGRGTLRAWRDARTLLCEVHDAGHIADPCVGSRRPAPDSAGGRGLWLVKQLCDNVLIRSSPAGTVVRVHKQID